MPYNKCLICNTAFYVKPIHQRKGWGKYCSINCRITSQFKGKQVSCFICKKQIYRSPKDLKNSDSGNFFCSKTCQTVWRNKIQFIGERHSNWKHGKSAYRRILRSAGFTEVCKLCKAIDKRILIVHHIDKNRKNNNVFNLIWLCHNCHYLVHHFIDEQSKLQNMVAVVQK